MVNAPNDDHKNVIKNNDERFKMEEEWISFSLQLFITRSIIYYISHHAPGQYVCNLLRPNLKRSLLTVM